MSNQLITQFENSIGQEFTVGGPLTKWRDEDGKPWPANHIWDTILGVNKTENMVIGKFMDASVDICRLKGDVPKGFKSVNQKLNYMFWTDEELETPDESPTGHGDICTSDADPGL